MLSVNENLPSPQGVDLFSASPENDELPTQGHLHEVHPESTISESNNMLPLCDRRQSDTSPTISRPRALRMLADRRWFLTISLTS